MLRGSKKLETEAARIKYSKVQVHIMQMPRSRIEDQNESVRILKSGKNWERVKRFLKEESEILNWESLTQRWDVIISSVDSYSLISFLKN